MAWLRDRHPLRVHDALRVLRLIRNDEPLRRPEPRRATSGTHTKRPPPGRALLPGLGRGAGPGARRGGALLEHPIHNSTEVAGVAEAYWYIVPVSYGASGIIMCVNALLNGMNRPLEAVIVSTSRVIVVNIPIAWIGARLYGASGVFFGISIANFVVGFAATKWMSHTCGPSREIEACAS